MNMCIKSEMIEEAKSRYKDIEPVSSRNSLDECFEYVPEIHALFLWYNDCKFKSTHIVKRMLPN